MANEFELAVMAELSEIKSLATKAASQAEATNESAIAATTALTDRIFAHPSGVVSTLQANIQEIKDERKSDAKWDRIHNILHYSLTPLVVVIHEIARKLGVSV